MSGSPPAAPSALPRAGRRAVYVDRDGTVNPDLRYLKDAERLEVFRGVAEAVRLLHLHGYLVVCVTNQSGIERGFYTADDVERIHRRVNEILRPEGAAIDAFYYCPHAPETGCRCRKPGTELFERAEADFRIVRAGSAIIGDRGLDIEAGDGLGLLTALVPSPGHAEEVDREMRARGIRPDIVAPSMRAAAARILAIG
jgi:D-glycero-D-manno-heptose 1,7-bisphosphate phosphatase